MPSTVGERMARIPNKNTAVELQVRSLLLQGKVRYRLHRRDLPGTPDLYVPRLRLAIFIHGCFWHGHECPRGKRPKTNAAFWNSKISRNIARDEQTRIELSNQGIDFLELWTCRRSEFHTQCEIIAQRYREGYGHAPASI
jgi:DNA mismatch endonuclease (patch repair protein)